MTNKSEAIKSEAIKSEAIKSDILCADVVITTNHDDAKIPLYARTGDAGFDLYTVEDVVLQPQEIKAIRTGLKMIIPKGYELQIRPRSGIAARTHLTVHNSPGTIDSGYRDEIKIIVKNGSLPSSVYSLFSSSVLTGDLSADNMKNLSWLYSGIYTIPKGTRIAQGVLKEYTQADFTVVDESTFTELSTFDRGGGLGSSGVK